MRASADLRKLNIVPTDGRSTQAEIVTDEDTPIRLPIFEMDDPDALSGSRPPASLLSIVASASEGSLSPSEFNGTLGRLNELLASVLYTPTKDFHGRDIILFVEQTATETRTLLSIPAFVQAVNDLPKLALENLAITALEDTEILVGGVKLTDPDSDFISVNLTCKHGVLSFSLATRRSVHYVAGSSAGDRHLSVEGPLTSVASALFSLRYKPDPHYFGNDELMIVADDGIGAAGNGAGSGIDDASQSNIMLVSSMITSVSPLALVI